MGVPDEDRSKRPAVRILHHTLDAQAATGQARDDIRISRLHDTHHDGYLAKARRLVQQLIRTHRPPSLEVIDRQLALAQMADAMEDGLVVTADGSLLEARRAHLRVIEVTREIERPNRAMKAETPLG